ncbi:MAG: twin-arginine translocation signal domain-containing protein [Actinobacteria bacterium]|nr:MAG: twin-arginine translocation signal domain-containing protein [Actinomycetota bacterium]
MSEFTRRHFLKLAGAGGAVVAGSGLGVFKLIKSDRSGETFTFRAVAGLPKQPMPAYATYVLDGSVDLQTGKGVVSRTLYAGAPEAMSAVTFGELTGSLRVTSIDGTLPRLSLRTVLEGSSRPGESRSATILVDQQRGEVRAPFFGNQVDMVLNP